MLAIARSSVRHLPSHPIGQWASGGAWFFVVFSLAYLAWAIGAQAMNPGTPVALYEALVDGPLGFVETQTAWGLAYDGSWGLPLAISQAAVVLTAAIMTLLPLPRVRRAGHTLLVGWATLWAVDLVHLARLDQEVLSGGQAGVALLLFACTIARALRPATARALNFIDPPDTAEQTVTHAHAVESRRAEQALDHAVLGDDRDFAAEFSNDAAVEGADSPTARTPDVSLKLARGAAECRRAARRVGDHCGRVWPSLRNKARCCGRGVSHRCARARASAKAARQAWDAPATGSSS